MLNASVGVQRVVARLRRPHSPSPSPASPSPVLDRAATRTPRVRPHAAVRPTHPPKRRRTLSLPAVPAFLRARPGLPRLSLHARLGHERTVAVAVAGIVLGASILSVTPGGTSGGDTGGPDGDGAAPRLAIGGAEPSDARLGSIEEAYVEPEAETDVEGAPDAGAVLGAADAGAARADDREPTAETPYVAPAAAVSSLSRIVAVDTEDPEAQAVIAAREAEAAPVEGPFLADGTLLKPVAVDTTVKDGSSLVQTYKVKAGDTLSGIAKAHGVSMMTLWWANKLEDRHELHQGQVLKIPAVSGLVVKVKAGDTLGELAKEHKVDEDEILETNGITDPNLVVGQVLVLPGAKGDPLPTPEPTKKATRSSSSGGGSSSGGSSRPPKTYSGGRFAWPAPGGRISQYYHYGHYGLDIDGDTGDRIVAAAKGTVIFAGWKGNGGGYQVWIAHGSGLYTTYNHMSSVAVGKGQRVAKGQRVGRMGATGFVTGSHLHFEVWKGKIWSGGRRVNPLAYY